MHKAVRWVSLVLLSIVLAIGTAFLLRVNHLAPEVSHLPSPTIGVNPAAVAESYPAIWSVHTHYVGSQAGKPKATWEQLQEMVHSGLITIASHTVNHLRLDTLSPKTVTYELQESKRVLEQQLGVPIQYFTYPEGDALGSVKQKVADAGYQAALSMSLDAQVERVANKSDDLLSIMRFGQSRFEVIVGTIAD